MAFIRLAHFVLLWPLAANAEDDEGYPDQGELGSCSLYTFGTVSNEQVVFAYGIEIKASTFREKLSAFADLEDVNLHGGSTSSQLVRLANSHMVARYPDSKNKRLFSIGWLEIKHNSVRELDRAVGGLQGVASSFAATTIPGRKGLHAIAAYRRDATDDSTVVGKNSWGSDRTQWPITAANWDSSSLVVPIIWAAAAFSSDNQSITHTELPDFTDEFGRWRDKQYPDLVTGHFRMFDCVKKTSDTPRRGGRIGAVVGIGRTSGSVKVQWFQENARPIDVVSSHLSSCAHGSVKHSGVGAAKNANLLAGGFRNGTEVVFFVNPPWEGISCLDRGIVKGGVSGGGLLVDVRGDTKRLQLSDASQYRQIMRPADEVEEWLASAPLKPGDDVYSLVSRRGWKPIDLLPGALGKLRCYVPRPDGSFHLDADFGDVQGSVLEGDLVAADLDKYDEAMAQKLPGGFHRAQSVIITDGKHKGRFAEINGPHPDLNEHLWVMLPGDVAPRGPRAASVNLVNIHHSSLRPNAAGAEL